MSTTTDVPLPSPPTTIPADRGAPPSAAVAAGLLVAVAPRLGAFVVAAWLGGIVLNLLTVDAPRYYDIALRDFGLMLGALTLGRLSLAVVPTRRR